MPKNTKISIKKGSYSPLKKGLGEFLISEVKKLKTQLGFIYRGMKGIFHNLFDKPGIVIKNSGNIGETYNGDNMSYYKLGKGEEKVLYLGGIHGNETGSVKLMQRWVNYMAENIPKDITAYVIPCLNIDGYHKALKRPDYFNGGKIGKVNGNSVDLNRNFPTTGWMSKSKIFIAGEYSAISGGKAPASEPEISSLLQFINKNNINIVYSFHNCWSTVLSLTPSGRLENYSKLSGYRIFHMDEWNKLDPAQIAGNMNTWGHENGINIIEIELKHRWGSDWEQNKGALIDSLNTFK